MIDAVFWIIVWSGKIAKVLSHLYWSKPRGNWWRRRVLSASCYPLFNGVHL